MRLHFSGDAMIGWEKRMLLRHYLAQGASKSALARQLGISRDTIHRWIRSGDLDRALDTTAVRYGPGRPLPTKLDAYRAIIEARLAATPSCRPCASSLDANQTRRSPELSNDFVRWRRQARSGLKSWVARAACSIPPQHSYLRNPKGHRDAESVEGRTTVSSASPEYEYWCSQDPEALDCEANPVRSRRSPARTTRCVCSREPA